jgi:F-type H+-transporting ATPase subunit delta
VNSISRRRVAKFIAKQLANGESVSRTAKVLAAYLVDNKQKRQLNLFVRDIETELANEYGHLAADITAARKLTTETKRALSEMLQRETGVKSVELIETIDPQLIGGVVVKTPEAEFDTSLKTKLTRLKAI